MCLETGRMEEIGASAFRLLPKSCTKGISKAPRLEIGSKSCCLASGASYCKHLKGLAPSQGHLLVHYRCGSQTPRAPMQQIAAAPGQAET